ncbi:MAG TPA: ATP synthase F0 subunit B [Syntrophales bacterium]|nr:ATP synthase F0 subunit B [Syntrophales bacterium]HRT71201.1 ATP synthase F0 subunit B [Syntrophales bacterium]
MVSIDYTLFIQIVNFLALIAILHVLLYKPILRIMQERENRLKASEEEVKSLYQTIERKTAEYEEKIRLAKMEAMNQRNEIQKQGALEAQRIIEAAREEISRMTEEFKEKLAKEMEEARKILAAQSRNISFEIAERVLGRTFDEQRI